ncbi:hypothetical protein ACWGMW_16335 [Streptomyces albidoflavus]|uniref:hypothetical protein n=1 Tax=Streptomyces sp. B29(2018) TaxID=2485016 RepID=UPI000FD68BC7|nr:hypothetical protein [Streptomyces sp. B29(2018)]
MFALKSSGSYPHNDTPLLSGVSYNPVTQMSELGGVPLLDAGAQALAATAHTTTAINSEDND